MICIESSSSCQQFAIFIVYVVMCRDFNIVDAMMNKLDSYAKELDQKITERTRELKDEQMKGEVLLYSVMPP